MNTDDDNWQPPSPRVMDLVGTLQEAHQGASRTEDQRVRMLLALHPTEQELEAVREHFAEAERALYPDRLSAPAVDAISHNMEMNATLDAAIRQLRG